MAAGAGRGSHVAAHEHLEDLVRTTASGAAASGLRDSDQLTSPGPPMETPCTWVAR